MQRRPPHYPRRLFAVLILGATGLALLAVGVTGDTGWALIAPGLISVIVALVLAGRIMAPYIGRASADTPRAARR
jgi:hypothetical protein